MKFNSRTQSGTTKTTNYEGGVAFKVEPITELYLRVATCLVNEPKFYGDSNADLERIIELVDIVGKKDPEFVLQLASYARNVLHLRSIPIVLLAESSANDNTRPFVREYTPQIIQRADEPAELISYIKSKIGNIGDQDQNTMLPNSIRKGLNLALRKFTTYHFAKYAGKNNDVSMRDVFRLVHPRPFTKQQQDLYKAIANEKLAPAETWETYISQHGSDRRTWEYIMPKMPIMAILRNLRNFIDNDCDLDPAIQKLLDEKTILNSKQFPFRFYTAYKAIENKYNRKVGRLLSALDTAMDIAVKNVPRLDGITAIFVDNSGSMDHNLSEKSEVTYREVGGMLGAIASTMSPDNYFMVFGSNIAPVNFSGRDSILTRAEKSIRTDVGGSTNAYLCFQWLIMNKVPVDRILLFSDMQCYDSQPSWDYYNSRPNSDSIAKQWNQYKKTVNQNAKLYSFDVSGYGTAQTPQGDPNVLLVGGWTENILKYIPYFERDHKSVIQEIRNYSVE
jgi:hypothetical protein